MTKTFIALSIAALLTLPAAKSLAANDVAPTTQGATDEGVKQKHAEAMERFRSALEQVDLTAEQKDKIKTIMSDARSKMQALKGESDAKSEARTILQKARQDVLAVLTPEQKAKLKEILQKDRSQTKA